MRLKLRSLLEHDNHYINDSIRLYENTEATCFPQHRHMAYEMIMPVENIYTILIEGQTVTLSEGDLFIIPSGIVHEIIAPPEGRRFFFMIDRDRLFAIDGLQDAEHHFYPFMLIRAGTSTHTQRFLTAAREYSANNSWAHTTAHLELSLMLVALFRDQIPTLTPERQSYLRKKDQRQLLFVDISAFVASHCAEDLTARDVADAAGYSQSYFERLFEEYMSMSFHNYLTQKRIELSKRLLLQSGDSITEIAHQVGFSSIATFNRVFRKQENMSPSAYREAHSK